MKTRFYIICHINAATGPEMYGRFEIGNDRKKAYELFSMLNGDKEMSRKNILCMELMETVNELPVNINMIGCTLNELAENCRIITKEIFNLHNLNLSS